MFEAFEVVRGAPMREYTTLRLGGPADYLAFPRSREEILSLIDEAKGAGLPVTVIGHGSNLLVLDGGIRGLVIRVEKNMRSIHREGNRLTAQAGAMLIAAAQTAAAAGLSGLEFASGIPGTVGGGLAMNAGAYGGEIGQVTAWAECLRPDGATVRLTGEELDFGYRHSAIREQGLIVTEAAFDLTPGTETDIRRTMAELNARRTEKQPLDQPSAGSAFKRPEGAFAAALIDQCGLKGYSIGGARVSEKHAGFLVNHGQSAADFLALMEHVRGTVLRETGIELEPEVRIIGVDQ